jgi:glycosyltransferase involved in cell wall biosynthesis
MVHPSIREGLPVSVMEGMACGLPVLCSEIRGNADLVDTSGGMLFRPNDVSDCQKAIEAMMISDLSQMGRFNQEKVKQASVTEINQRMYCLYTNEQ